MIYPFLFFTFPVLMIYANNTAEVGLLDIIRALSITIVGSIIIFIGVFYLLRNREKSALIVTATIALIFGYGRVVNWVPGYVIIIGFIASLVVIIFYNKRLQFVHIFLNVFSCLFLIFIIITIWGNSQITSDVHSAENSFDVTNMNHNNIYYIVVDSYSRDDILMMEYGFDNSYFTNFLEQQGFRILRNSNSNYLKTYLSLSSSLNMNFIETFAPNDIGQEYVHAIGHNLVGKFLKSNGYNTVFISSGLFQRDLSDYDDVYVLTKDYGMTYFERVLYNITVFSDIFGKNVEISSRDNILFAFDTLDDISNRIVSPSFIFFYVMMPHGPFILDRYGNYSENSNYIEHVMFTNSRLMKSLEYIVKVDPKSIIILQSDHGQLSMTNAYHVYSEILHAYYFPDGFDGVYDNISPINTFRLIFNKYFDANLPLLSDIISNKMDNK